jgi:hypothetical protein
LKLSGYFCTTFADKNRLGVRENPVVKTNQQVTDSSKKFSGTSETTREATTKTSTFTSFFNFYDYEQSLPQHISKMDPRFLTWFIGFFEGDGSVAYRDSNVGSRTVFDTVSKKADFEITQEISNIKLLHKIRKVLGFGRVLEYEKNGRKYARFYTSKREHILRLVVLFNGNLVLTKRREQFEEWLNVINQGWQLNIPLKHWTGCVTLQNAWLSGFTDADGGFNTNSKNGFEGTKDHKGNIRFRFTTKYYITQDGEMEVLEKIKQLAGATNKISKLTNGRSAKQYNRLEITSSSATTVLIDYFSRFPLKGQRRIDVLRWARVHGYKTRGVSLNEGAAKTLSGLLEKLQDPGDTTRLVDVTNNFSAEENQLFTTLPLNNKNPNRLQNPQGHVQTGGPTS